MARLIARGPNMSIMTGIMIAAITGLASNGYAQSLPDDIYLKDAPSEKQASNVQPWKPAPAEWQKMLEFYTTNNIFPGASVLIKSPKWGVRFVSSGKPILEQPNVPFKPTTQFRIGSCTKATVAVAIHQLDYEHKLNLDDPITRHLPPEITAKIPNAEDITILHCLNMTSGLRSFTDIPLLGDTTAETVLNKYTQQEILEMALDWNSYVFMPGETEDGELHKYDYTNTGYLLCGLILEQIEKKPLHKILDERVFSKIGMTDSFLAQDYRITPRMAHGYTAFYETGEWNNCVVFDQCVPWAAGAVVSTPFDLLHFYESLFTTNTLLQPSSRRKWLRMNYAYDHKGYGNAVLEEITDYGSMFGHGGTVLGYLTLMLYDPEREFYYVGYLNTWDNKFSRAEMFLRISYLAYGSPEAPTPEDGADCKLNNATANLSWRNGTLGGEEYHVYIGTAEEPVFQATLGNHPETSLYRVKQLSLAKKDLVPGKRYYWRVDTHHKLSDREIANERDEIEALMSNFNTYVYRDVPEYRILPGPVWTFIAK